MTDVEVLNLAEGTWVWEALPGDQSRRRMPLLVTKVKHRGVCTNRESASFGHAFVLVESEASDGRSSLGFTIESDDYIAGGGYPTHDAAGNRIRGWEVVREPSLPEGTCVTFIHGGFVDRGRVAKTFPAQPTMGRPYPWVMVAVDRYEGRDDVPYFGRRVVVGIDKVRPE